MEWEVRITERITKIEDDRVQFHIEVKDFASAFLSGRFDFKDAYVECKFPEEQYVYRLNREDTIGPYGKLDKVGNVVKLKNGRFLR